MIYFKFILFTLLKLGLLLTLPFAMLVIPLFTRAEGHDKPLYTWGGWYGTYDNPPQGDQGYVTKRCMFPLLTTGWKGYVNRALWMWRNKLYGYNAFASIPFGDDVKVEFTGNPNISDKYKVAGSYTAYAFKGKKLIGFEYYAVLPWSESRNFRIRLGWKILTRKFEQYGFAQLVTTANPFDGYGDN